ncbi:MAG: hypothetical protein JW789_02740 [Candidatus Aenigmarchaeota archaeon]|nr:hypothetical protein [Candidatus Aenigmarchaeota archaeon]
MTNHVHEKIEVRKKELEKKMRIPKIMFAVLFAALFIVLSQTKMFPIMGTEFNFSLAVMFGPALGGLLGMGLGAATIVLSQVIGVAIGMYSADSLISIAVFFPILFGSLYFARSFRGDRRLMIIPIAMMIAFMAHPIGQQVWFYSLFWVIPLVVIQFKKQIDSLLKHPIAQTYSYSLGTAFVDHSVGSVMYLWAFAIPAEMWIAAIPVTLFERLLIALGITFSFHAVKAGMKALQDVAMAVAHAEPQKETQKEPVPVHAK